MPDLWALGPPPLSLTSPCSGDSSSPDAIRYQWSGVLIPTSQRKLSGRVKELTQSQPGVAMLERWGCQGLWEPSHAPKGGEQTYPRLHPDEAVSTSSMRPTPCLPLWEEPSGHWGNVQGIRIQDSRGHLSLGELVPATHCTGGATEAQGGRDCLGHAGEFSVQLPLPSTWAWRGISLLHCSAVLQPGLTPS